jgi:tetratricopeptide (TPR) repeat protein
MASGKKLEDQANEKNKGSLKKFLFGLIEGYNDFNEELASLFNKAGNAYILEKKISDAIRCYMTAYETYNKTNKYNSYYSIMNLKLAINYARQINEYSEQKIISLLTIVAQHYGNDGKMKEHNDQYVEISKIHENNNVLQNAYKVLDMCVDVDNVSFDEIYKRKAEILIKMNKLTEASEICENIVTKIINRDKKILSCATARKYELLAILSALATNDIVSTNNKINKFIKLDDTFQNSYEGTLVISLVDAFENNNILDFNTACSTYDKIMKLKSIHMSLLETIKQYVIIDYSNNNTDNTNNVTQDHLNNDIANTDYYNEDDYI